MTAKMESDRILLHLKPYGRWQIGQVIAVGIIFKFFTSMTFVSTVFIGWSPPHHCTIPENATLNATVPGVYKDGVFVPDKCLMFHPQDKNATVPCSNGWTFETGGWSTIVTQWTLVCDQDVVSEFSQALNALGLLIGSLMFTTVSDLFGRKPTMLILNLVCTGIGVVTAFVPNVYWYSAMRVLSGATTMGVALSTYVYCTEIVPVAQRSFTTNIMWIFAPLGQMFMTLLAFVIKDWRYFQLSISLPVLITIAGFWIFEETIPWLLANKRGKDAARVTLKVGKFNGIKVPRDVIEKLEAETVEGPQPSLAERMKEWFRCCRARQSSEDVGIKEIFSHAKLRLYTILLCILWFVTVFIYYGLTLSTASFAGDRFVNYILNILVEIPAYFSCVFILRRFGRRYPIMAFYGICGVSLFITGFVPVKTPSGTDLTGLIITLNTIGKYGISCAFSVIYLYTGEIYPTKMRNRGVGLGSGVARVGGILSPFSAYLSRYHSWLVGVVFGVLSLLTGLLVLPLPETGNKSMPQTMEDVENLGRKVPKKQNGQNGSSVGHEKDGTIIPLTEGDRCVA